MTLATSVCHGVASSIQVWRRELRRQARPVRAKSGVASLHSVCGPLPPTLFGDALVSLCGKRLRDALVMPPVASNEVGEDDTRRHRVTRTSPRPSADEPDAVTSGSPGASTKHGTDRAAPNDAPSDGREITGVRADFLAQQLRAWRPDVAEQLPGPPRAMRGDGSPATRRERPSRRHDDGRDGGKRSRDGTSPLAVALRRLERARSASEPVTPATPSVAHAAQRDPGAGGESDMRGEPLPPRDPRARDEMSVRYESDRRDVAPPIVSAGDNRRPWWAPTVDEIHARGIAKPATSVPTIAASVDAPEEAFAEMLADVLRQQALQHGVFVP